MKKLFLLTLGLGLFAVSCGTKESSMSSANTDSVAVDNATQAAPPATTDTVSTKMANPDSLKIKMDSMSTPVK